MKLKKKSVPYHCFNEQGKCDMPSIERILEMKSKNIEPILFIDSCVAIHICKYIDYKEKANVDKVKLLTFKKYIEDNHVSINPLFALFELCTTKDVFDKQKFIDFQTRITFFKLLTYSDLKKYNFNYLEFETRNRLKIERNINKEDIIDVSFLSTYCSLLKIRSLAKKGLSKQKSKKNIFSFLDWMIDELGLVLGVEYNLAIRIFGGNTEYRKMIWLDGKSTDVKQKLIGTAWDIIHARICSSSFLLSKYIGEPVDAYFVTSDRNLYKLFSNTKLKGIFDNQRVGATTMFLTDCDQPHLDDSFILENDKKMLKIQLDTMNNKVVLNRDELLRKIEMLEIDI